MSEQQQVNWPTPIRDLPEAATPAADDFIHIDGVDNGSRKLKAQIATAMDPNAAMAWTASHTFAAQVGFGSNAAPPWAHVAIAPGTATKAPLKLGTAGAVMLTTPEAGAIETDGVGLYWTDKDDQRQYIATEPELALLKARISAFESRIAQLESVIQKLKDIG